MWVLMLDDQRSLTSVKIPEKYDCYEKVLVKTYSEFVDTINKRGLPKAVFLDHDLSVEAYREGARTHYSAFNYNNLKGERTGYDAAKFLIKYCQEKKLNICDFYSHSMNPVGRKNILDLLNNYKKKEQNAPKN